MVTWPTYLFIRFIVLVKNRFDGYGFIAAILNAVAVQLDLQSVHVGPERCLEDLQQEGGVVEGSWLILDYQRWHQNSLQD